MFTKKSSIDVKKLILKVQDSKKDSASRLRHLRTVLGKTILFYFSSSNMTGFLLAKKILRLFIVFTWVCMCVLSQWGASLFDIQKQNMYICTVNLVYIYIQFNILMVYTYT